MLAPVQAQQLVGGQFQLSETQKVSAQNAVQKLADEVLKSNYSYAVEKIYNRWQVRQIKRYGSKEKLLHVLNNVGAQLNAKGITIDTVKALEPSLAYKVFPKSKLVNKTRQTIYEMLVFVPTQKQLTIYIPNAKKRVLMQRSFQVAIAKEGSSDWTFIDGATLKAQDLHTLFPLLPMDMKMPKVSYKEVTQ